ncbi:metallophosphoesterase MPPED2-like isoform X1 [Rhopilema esculentum]|uniref:metallophosphoesterase MPPED2-like isoform X1 n=1 Tax=Rhopilema esculentum TaxID=499914 RepID=UPI0031D02A22
MADKNIDDEAETNATGNIENGQCSQEIEQDLASLTVDASVHRIEKDNTGSNSDKTSSENKVPVKVHPLTERQHSLFKELSKTKGWKESFEKLEPLPLNSPKKDGHIRFVCISDTHNGHGKLNLPDGDILLHAGDFTLRGKLKEVESFCEFLKEIKSRYKHIVVIAGNHELTFDDKKDLFFGLFKTNADCNRGADLKEMLQNHCIYLEDEGIELMGFRIYGSPWQPYHRGWAFNLPRGEALLEKWNKIPEGTDILMTHGPPLGHGDLTFFDQHVGCVELLSTVQERVKPKFHVFGHIHEGNGMTTDGSTTYINAAICNFRYQPVQKPIIFDLPVQVCSPQECSSTR